MVVVNFSTSVYAPGQQRLSKSLGDHKQLMLNDYTSIGSPTHNESPYEFKLYSIDAGFEMDDIVVWVDASFWLVGDLSKIERIIKNDGYFFTECGHWVGDWTNKFTRDYFNLTEEEAKVPGGMKMFSAGFVGFHKESEVAQSFLKQWKDSAKAGCFRGSFNDHRHDQSAGSIIAERMGLKYQRGGEHMSYIGGGYSPPEEGSVFYLQGL